jgi:hypothetical protein
MYWHKDNEEKLEYQDLINKLKKDVEILERRLSKTEFDLKESNYQCLQWENKFSRLKEEMTMQETAWKNKFIELQSKAEITIKQFDDKNHLLSIEIEKINKISEKLSSYTISNNDKSISKALQHLVYKLAVTIQHTKEISVHGSTTFISKTDSSSIDHIISISSPEQMISSTISPKVNQNHFHQGISADNAVDAALFDVCKKLEEENASLTETIESLQQQLAETKKEATAIQLIPHYRLAIVRMKTYATNLVEQIKREEETSAQLRQRLQETYEDLQRSVEEKRRLYQKMGKQALKEDSKWAKKFIDPNIIETSKLPPTAYAYGGVEIESTVGNVAGKESQMRSTTTTTSTTNNKNNITATVSNSNSPAIFLQHATNQYQNQSSESDEDRLQMEQQLQSELRLLDSQIEQLRDKLGKAAYSESQRILAEICGMTNPHINIDEKLG